MRSALLALTFAVACSQPAQKDSSPAWPERSPTVSSTTNSGGSTIQGGAPSGGGTSDSGGSGFGTGGGGGGGGSSQKLGGGGSSDGGGSGSGGSASYWCFDVRWDDGKTNSECVPEQSKCNADLNEMKGYASDGHFTDCRHFTEVYCYSTTTNHPLCFTNMRDCENSRAIISGSGCSVVRN